MGSSGYEDEDEDEDDVSDDAADDGRVCVTLGTVRPPPAAAAAPLPWKKRSHSPADAGLRVHLVEGRDLERDEDLLVVEDRAARDSILDTLDTQLPCLEGVFSRPSSSSAVVTFKRGRWSCRCPKMGILTPPSVSGGLVARGVLALALMAGGRLSLGACGRLSLGACDVLNRVEFTACSYATSSSLSSLALVPIHTPTPTGNKPLRIPVETVQDLNLLVETVQNLNLVRRPLRHT